MTTKVCFVNAYAVTRHFGGPEEGGWWYNAGHPLASVPCKESKAKKTIKKLEKLFEDVAEGDIYSALGGVEVQVYVEDDFAKKYPETRPYYE